MPTGKDPLSQSERLRAVGVVRLGLFVCLLAVGLIASGAGAGTAAAVLCVSALLLLVYVWLRRRQRQQALGEADTDARSWPAGLPNLYYRGAYRGRRRPTYPAALFLGRLTLTSTQAVWRPSRVTSRPLEEQTYVPTGPITVRSRWGLGQIHEVTIECGGESTQFRLWFANDFAAKASDLGWRLIN